MTSKSEKDRAKQIQDRCQNILIQMLKDEDNKYCVDCDAKGKFIHSFFIRKIRYSFAILVKRVTNKAYKLHITDLT